LQRGFGEIEKRGFKKKVYVEWNKMVSKTLMDDTNTDRGLMLHVVDIYPLVLENANLVTNIQLFFGLKPIFDVSLFK